MPSRTDELKADLSLSQKVDDGTDDVVILLTKTHVLLRVIVDGWMCGLV